MSGDLAWFKVPFKLEYHGFLIRDWQHFSYIYDNLWLFLGGTLLYSLSIKITSWNYFTS